MSCYSTDTVDITYNNINPETGEPIFSSTETDVECRVETYNGMIMSTSGKEEKGNYLVLIEKEGLKIGDIIHVKTVMGVSITRKSFDIKKIFYAGGFSMEQLEVYL